jgi:glycosyltransferase involved in cell wall biosynthesis
MLLAAPTEMVRGGGHKYASWAHAIVRQVLPNVRLLFPGTGPNEHNVRSFAGSTGFDEDVFFTGDQFGKEDVLAGADVAVFFHETDCGVSALVGAMCAGVPIAACDTPDISECAPHEDSSLLGRAKDPRSISATVLRLLEDPALRKRLIKSGRRRAEMHFRPELSRRRLDNIYDALLSDPSA